MNNADMRGIFSALLVSYNEKDVKHRNNLFYSF